METDVRKLLHTLANGASGAAEEALDVLHDAKRALSEKYDEVLLVRELSRLKAQQERLFSHIGRTMFLLRVGTLSPEIPCQGDKTPQQHMDSLLLSAEQLQQGMQAMSEKLGLEKPEQCCPKCSRVCQSEDAFCAVCGERLGS